MEEIQKKFLNMLKVERNFSDHTLKAYHDDLAQFNQFLEQELLNLRTFEYKDARNYLSYLYSNNLKRTTVSRKISTLRTFYEFWMTQDTSVNNPFIQLVHPKKEQYLPQFFYEEEMEALFNTVSNDAKKGLRDRVVIELLYATGIRVSELVNIKVMDLDMNLPGVKVLGKGNKERFVPFGEFCRQSIEQYLEKFKPLKGKSHPYLIVNMKGDPITERGVRYLLNDVVERTAGVTEIHPHKLRHTGATLAKQAELSLEAISEALTHSDKEVTKTYVNTKDTVNQTVGDIAFCSLKK